jgi:hypothetical protein
MCFFLEIGLLWKIEMARAREQAEAKPRGSADREARDFGVGRTVDKSHA